MKNACKFTTTSRYLISTPNTTKVVFTDCDYFFSIVNAIDYRLCCHLHMALLVSLNIVVVTDRI